MQRAQGGALVPGACDDGLIAWRACPSNECKHRHHATGAHWSAEQRKAALIRDTSYSADIVQTPALTHGTKRGTICAYAHIHPLLGTHYSAYARAAFDSCPPAGHTQPPRPVNAQGNQNPAMTCPPQACLYAAPFRRTRIYEFDTVSARAVRVACSGKRKQRS